MQYDAPEDKLQEFIEICQKHRLKITPQRVKIFKCLLGLDSHPTADAVYQIVKKEYPNISFDTVNRTLLTLVEIGVLDTVEIFGGAKRFDTNVMTHHHFLCLQCGKVYDFHSAIYNNLIVPEDIQEQFRVVGKRVVLKGFCKTC